MARFRPWFVALPLLLLAAAACASRPVANAQQQRPAANGNAAPAAPRFRVGIARGLLPRPKPGRLFVIVTPRRDVEPRELIGDVFATDSVVLGRDARFGGTAAAAGGGLERPAATELRAAAVALDAGAVTDGVAEVLGLVARVRERLGARGDALAPLLVNTEDGGALIDRLGSALLGDIQVRQAFLETRRLTERIELLRDGLAQVLRRADPGRGAWDPSLN